MKKLYEDYHDQHLRQVMAYGKTDDHKLYVDAKHTAEMTMADAMAAYMMGVLFINDGTSSLRPVSANASGFVTMGGTTTVAGTVWTAAADEV